MLRNVGAEKKKSAKKTKSKRSSKRRAAEPVEDQAAEQPLPPSAAATIEEDPNKTDDPFDDQADVISSNYSIPNLPSTLAKQAILVDTSSGAILFEKNADMSMAPSSMSKIATVCYVLGKVRAGELQLDTTFSVPASAYRKEGSTMFLKQGQDVSVHDLLLGIIITSGNDAASTIAIRIAGSEDAFSEDLTCFVHSIGATNSTFTNASGLPDPLHQTTARDLYIIAKYAIEAFPEYYSWYSQPSFSFNNVTQKNRNTLLTQDIGCDGLKPGRTQAGGFGTVASAHKNGRRVILVVNGYKSERDLNKDAKALLLWGLGEFENSHLFKAGAPIVRLPVWYGKESYVTAVVDKDIALTLPKTHLRAVRGELCYDIPLASPIRKGDQVGEVLITSSALTEPIVIPLRAAISVEEAGFFKKVGDSFRYLLWGGRVPEK